MKLWTRQISPSGLEVVGVQGPMPKRAIGEQPDPRYVGLGYRGTRIVWDTANPREGYIIPCDPAEPHPDPLLRMEPDREPWWWPFGGRAGW